MKRLFLIVIIITFFCGCSSVDELSTQNTEIAANYMANVVCKYNKNSKQKLVKTESLNEDDTVSETSQDDTNNDTETNKNDETQATDSSSEDTQEDVVDVSLSDIYDDKGNIEYVFDSASVVDSYSEDSYLLIEPEDGYEILTIKFKLTNISEKIQNIQLSSKNIKYCLKFDDCSFLPLMTVAENDIMFLEVELKPNESNYATLFFQVKKGMSYDNTNLEIVSDKKRCILRIGVDKK